MGIVNVRMPKSLVGFKVVVKKRSVLQTFFSTKETFVSSTTYAAIPYSGIFLWKAVQDECLLSSQS